MTTIDNHWMCCDPECPVGFHDPAAAHVDEDEPCPPGAAEPAQRTLKDLATLTAVSRWVSKRTGPGKTTSRCIPLDAPCPEGWTEGGIF